MGYMKHGKWTDLSTLTPRPHHAILFFGFSDCFARSGTQDVIRVLRDSYPRFLGASHAQTTAIGPGLSGTSTVTTFDCPDVIRLTYKHACVVNMNTLNKSGSSLVTWASMSVWRCNHHSFCYCIRPSLSFLLAFYGIPIFHTSFIYLYTKYYCI